VSDDFDPTRTPPWIEAELDKLKREGRMPPPEVLEEAIAPFLHEAIEKLRSRGMSELEAMERLLQLLAVPPPMSPDEEESPVHTTPPAATNSSASSSAAPSGPALPATSLPKSPLPSEGAVFRLDGEERVPYLSLAQEPDDPPRKLRAANPRSTLEG